VRGTDATWKALFESADAVSEGSLVREGASAVWYGSTSIVLRMPETASAPEAELMAAVASKDVHVRLRAVRIARREAQLRAPSSLGVSSCEIRVVPEAGRLRIDVDIQAPLIEGRRKATPVEG